jgi:hypothetical protein
MYFLFFEVTEIALVNKLHKCEGLPRLTVDKSIQEFQGAYARLLTGCCKY